ncbi:selenocysteine-specific translation elongation factor [Ottowia testudinis]|uniref:Selenocysteine-specific elongation factor n=1 Tax=Ottowia testudinis TaxID=2816950 RepID=A0A975H4J8_9BURK|nr:selenocysteine-specific translation elongation factor [Ottowia testudinis]QTD46396.1 selenocysteine-specific translation elongation factor [Ottowia testudinis]
MIVGTAGHIDHGKTTLVRALTGVDTDRLPEEKKRGISIELGYAFLDAPGGGRIGFIDVPGHERLVHTMVAGASGIDFALLLVAADDGPMPQTLEHLAVLSLLGVARGAVVITKADRADAERIDAVRAEMAELLAPTPLAGAPVVAVSAPTGAGIDTLRALVLEAARASGTSASGTFDPQTEAPAFRLAIDRGFTLAGTGTVVTGTVHAGQVRVGDALALVPGTQHARARSLHAQNQPVGIAHAGQRCAVALVGLARDEVARGQWLTDPTVALATNRLDARLTLWHAEPRALRSGARVLAHIGAAQVAATLTVLDHDALAPGATALVQLLLHAPVGAWHGERVLLRDAAASRTLAGGTVLDPFAPTRYRRTPQRLAELGALTQASAAARLAALLAVAPHGVDLHRFAAAQGLAAAPLHAVPDTALAQDGLALGATQSEAFEALALAALQKFHDRQPDELGPDSARLRRLAAPRLPAPLWQALLARLAGRGALVLHGAVVHLPTHGAQLSANETRIAQKVAPALAQAGFEGAWARDLAKNAGEGEPLTRTTLARLARRGELHQIVKDLYLPPATLARLAAIAREVGAAHGGDVLAAQFRDATGLGRKRAIQILEYFDRIGLTRRVGDMHKLRADCTLFLP